jgi:hypothetical protein
MTDEQRQQEGQKEPEVRRPDEAVKDLEPEQAEGDAVKGGNAPSYIKYQT